MGFWSRAPKGVSYNELKASLDLAAVWVKLPANGMFRGAFVNVSRLTPFRKGAAIVVQGKTPDEKTIELKGFYPRSKSDIITLELV